MTRRQKFQVAFLLIVGIYLVLMIPDADPPALKEASQTPFEWRQDSLWKKLEHQFREARRISPDSLTPLISRGIRTCDSLLQQLASDSAIQAHDPRLQVFLDQYFLLGPLVAAGQQQHAYAQLYAKARRIIKKQSTRWSMQDSIARRQLYKLLYGMRAGQEEALMQWNEDFDPVELVTAEPSVTPAAVVQGIEIHSGDLLVSRGGAEVSAFISRSNDFPGNFSHVALAYVPEETGEVLFIEAHIEKGVAVATAEEYLRDTKLRFMVVRPRADLPALRANPQLPHLAAKQAYQSSLARHIPYDFKMNFYDSSAMFCSEVGSFAYQQQGIELWQGVSTISARGTASWLSTFGVENFVTQMPSDLEYDPQLSIVAEWRDPTTLLKDHMDNAVMDALLEEAAKGRTIRHNPWMLPVARVVKGISLVQNLFGKPGIIPEGMSASRALKNNAFVELYNRVREGTRMQVGIFIKENGYVPPYWQTLDMARQSMP